MDAPECHVPADALQLEEDKLARLPRSARLVFASILDHGPVTQPELSALTGQPVRTVRFAARRLLDEGLVVTHLNLADVRRRHFCVSPRLVEEGMLRKLGIPNGDCVVVVQHNGRTPSMHWQKVLFRASVS